MTAPLQQPAQREPARATNVDAPHASARNELKTPPPSGGLPLRGEGRSRISEHAFYAIALGAALLPLLVLLIMLWGVGVQGAERLSWDFLTSFPSRKPQLAGILAGLAGSCFLMLLTAVIALPLGIGAAIYLEEYAKRSWLTRLIEVNIANLAGVPSIVYGLLGLDLFVRALQLGRSLIAGACTLSLLVLPMVVMVTREALRTVPQSLREASYALGATRWQAIRQVVLPMAYPSILTGTILTLSRAIGETAPLLVVGALTYITFVPDGLDAPFTALPIQIFHWVSRPQHGFVVNAAAAIIVLLGTMLVLNGGAIYLRTKLQRKNHL